MKKSTKYIVKAALIACVYFLSTVFLAPISFGANQIRISEALNMLVYFTESAVPGLTVGCLLANLSSPYGIIDIIGGSLTTLLSGIIALKIKNKYLVGIPCIVLNAIFVGAVLNLTSSVPFIIGAVSVGFGQCVSIYLISLPLPLIIEKNTYLKSLFKD